MLLRRVSNYIRPLSRCQQLRAKSSLVECDDPEIAAIFESDLLVKEDFISPEEEASLLNEIEPYMKKLRYEYDHWDDVNEQDS